jgi:hypothetical protein
MNDPKGMVGDRINGDPLDSRRSNLRVVAWRQNALDVHRERIAARFQGVSASSKGYHAHIIHYGIYYRASSFDTPEATRAVYLMLAKMLLGDEAAIKGNID